MPKRPPRQWMRSCIKGVKGRKGVRDAGAICGNTWYNVMTKSDRQAALRIERRRK